MVSVISLGALGLRLHMLGVRSLWVDEGMSVEIARLPWFDFFGVLWRREGNMSLYYALLRGWLYFGDSEAKIRSLSVIASVGAVIAIYFLGRRLFGRNAGAIAAILLALNVFHIRYAQEARCYALLSLMVILASHCFVSAIESSSWKKWLLYAALMAAAVYLHFFAIFVLGAHFIAAIVWRRPIPWRKLAVSAAFFAILIYPIVAFLRANANNHQLDWVKFPTWHEFYDSMVFFTGQGGAVLLWFSVALVVAGMALLVVETRKAPTSNATFSLGMLILWLLLPIAALLGISLVKPLFVVRYIMLSLPALALVLARVLTVITPKWRIAAFLVLIIFSVRGVREYYSSIPRDPEDWRSAAQFYVDHVQPGDAVFFNAGPALAVFDYYVTCDTHSRPHNIVFPFHGDKMTMRDFEGIPNPLFLKFMTKGVNRVWAVDWIIAPSGGPLLGKTFQAGESARFQNAIVSLYVRRPEEPNADHAILNSETPQNGRN